MSRTVLTILTATALLAAFVTTAEAKKRGGHSGTYSFKSGKNFSGHKGKAVRTKGFESGSGKPSAYIPGSNGIGPYLQYRKHCADALFPHPKCWR